MFETSHILSNSLNLSHVLSTLLDQSRALNSIGNRKWAVRLVSELVEVNVSWRSGFKLGHRTCGIIRHAQKLARPGQISKKKKRKGFDGISKILVTT